MNKSSTLKNVLVAVGGSLIAAPTAALELGEVKVHSTLGQPLRASITFALGPRETISDTCVSLQANMAANGLPSVSNASMIVTDGVIAITGRSVVREPIMTMQVNVRCPYTGQLSHDYMMFIDPAGTAAEPITAATAASIASQPQLSAPIATPTPATARRRQVNTEPITDTTRYQVKFGDTLSEIAQRIENRPVDLQEAVNTIFEANPEAFVDNDPNKLMAGSWLSIPSFGASESVSVVDELAPASSPVDPASDGVVHEPAADATAHEPNSALVDPKSGDRILDSDNPLFTPIDSVVDKSVLIPDTLLDSPVITSDSPNVPVAIIQPAAPAEPATTNWMLWFAGSGLAIIAALLLFGRRFRIGSSPIVPVEPQRRQADSDMQKAEAIGDVDTTNVDDLPTGEILALDADLFVGTGLHEATEIDVAQDFGFGVETDLDLESPEEMSITTRLIDTAIIPPPQIEEPSILENEILPGEDDDYDMSMIVDATKSPKPGDVTEVNLEAVQVDLDDETLITSDYTVSQEKDYEIIEKEYEDEMSATQVLDEEVQKAAEDLVARMADDVADKLIEMPLATVHELDDAAQIHAENDQEISEEGDTGIYVTENMEAEEETVEAPAVKTTGMPKGRSKAG